MGRGGQPPYQIVEAVDLQRSTALPNMADASEPSLLVDAPVLCRAVREDEEKESLNTHCSNGIKHFPSGRMKFNMNIL